jgi:hypothetical protein
MEERIGMKYVLRYFLVSGQKFATLELKVILSTILCQYVVKSMETEQQLNLMGEIVLLNKEGIQVSITSRR